MTVPARKPARLTAADRQAALIDAACACILRGGIRAFTVDQVMATAGVSRGLIAHHFGSMDGLLVAVYRRMYQDWIAVIDAPRPGLTRLQAVVEAVVSPALFSPDVHRIWLTLWAEIATNPSLRDEHRRQFSTYRDTLAAALRDEGRTDAAADTLARALICLFDGFGVQRSLEPGLLTEGQARAAVQALLGG
jgi:TetR/AcrR family transcriptional regulator, transcriptional repressor of bet genes